MPREHPLGWFVPETIVFQYRKAYRLYFSDKEGRVLSVDLTKKRERHAYNLEDAFLGEGLGYPRPVPTASNIRSFYVYHERGNDLMHAGKPRIEYLDTDQTRAAGQRGSQLTNHQGTS